MRYVQIKTRIYANNSTNIYGISHTSAILKTKNLKIKKRKLFLVSGVLMHNIGQKLFSLILQVLNPLVV